MAYEVGDRVRARIGTRNAIVVTGTVVGITDRGYRVELDAAVNGVQHVVLSPSHLEPLPDGDDDRAS